MIFKTILYNPGDWWRMEIVLKTGWKEENTVIQLAVVAHRLANTKLVSIITANLDTLTNCMGLTIVITMLLNVQWCCMLTVVFPKQKLPKKFARVMAARRFHPVF